jgi:hypothetical protein
MSQLIRRYLLITASLLTIGLAAGSAQADSPVLGAMLGGGTGAWVGSSVGGRDGAIIGGALGAAAGVVIASDYRDHRRAPTYYAPQPVYHYAPPAVVYSAPVYYQRYDTDWGRHDRRHHRDHYRHGYDNGHHYGHHGDHGRGRH